MFLKTEDGAGPVCINMDTGLRLRPGKDTKTGMETGIKIIFPDGSTNVTVRGSYDRVCDTLDARPAE